MDTLELHTLVKPELKTGIEVIGSQLIQWFDEAEPVTERWEKL